MTRDSIKLLRYVVSHEVIPINRTERVRVRFKTNDVKSIPNKNRDGVIRTCLGHRKHTLSGHDAPAPVLLVSLNLSSYSYVHILPLWQPQCYPYRLNRPILKNDPRRRILSKCSGNRTVMRYAKLCVAVSDRAFRERMGAFRGIMKYDERFVVFP